MKINLTIIITFLFGSISMAQEEIDPLIETQKVLTQPERRIEVIKTNPSAQKVDAQVRELMGQNSENLYRLSSDFLPYILQMGHGDPTKMAEILTRAARDPASFANNLPPELKAKVTNMAEKVKPLPEERKP